MTLPTIMRSREDIEKDMLNSGYHTYLIIELLLDMRDVLVQEEREQIERSLE
jgi:hypothetical protein